MCGLWVCGQHFQNAASAQLKLEVTFTILPGYNNILVCWIMSISNESMHKSINYSFSIESKQLQENFRKLNKKHQNNLNKTIKLG